MRRVGDVLEIDVEALEQRMERDVGQQSQKGSVIGYCSCGAAYPPRIKRGGDRGARRQRQRANRGHSRDDRIVSCALARALNPPQGGSVPRDTETPSKLQLLQQFAIAGSAEGKKIRSMEDQAIYVGISNPTNRLADDDAVRTKTGEKANKKGEPSAAGTEQLNKIPRLMKDGLLLVVTARINGHPVRTLIDSGATRCFRYPCLRNCSGSEGKAPGHIP